MRSRYPVPAEFHFYCTYLKQAGYYCMNPGKTDYNIVGNDKAPWDKGKSWKDAPAGKPSHRDGRRRGHKLRRKD